MSTAYWTDTRKLIGVAQVRAHRALAFVWKMAPHEFYNWAKYHSSTTIRSETGNVYTLQEFLIWVGKRSIHELETDQDDDLAPETQPQGDIDYGASCELLYNRYFQNNLEERWLF